MKTRLPVSTSALMALVAISYSTFTQETLRGLYVKKKAEGLELKVFKVKDDKLSLVDPSDTFKNGDSIKIHFRSNFDGYVYFVNIELPSRVATVRYKHEVHDGKEYWDPGDGEFEFKGEGGTEILRFMMSH